MKKKLIRLTESDLHKIVKWSVNRLLREEVDTGQVPAQSEKKSTAAKLPDDVSKEIRRLRHQIEILDGEGKDTTELTNKIKKLKSKYINEVTDFGNNIYGSSSMNPTYKENYGVDKDEYYEIRSLIYDIKDKFLSGEDLTENYTNDSANLILCGTIAERIDDINKIADYCKKNGFKIEFNEGYNWSGHNKYKVVRLKFKRISFSGIQF